MNGYVIALDQGTTSSRAIVFDRSGSIPLRRFTRSPAGSSMTRWSFWSLSFMR